MPAPEKEMNRVVREERRFYVYWLYGLLPLSATTHTPSPPFPPFPRSPKNDTMAMTGVHLRACIPPVAWPPWITKVSFTGATAAYGYVPSVLDLLRDRQGFTLEYATYDTTPFLNGDLSYAAFVSDLLSDGTCDLMIHASDVPEDYKVSVDGSIQVVHTTSFVNNDFSVLVKKRKTVHWRKLATI
jgi:hypothetical protein